MDISNYVLSKEEWNGLELGSRTLSTLLTQIAQRNTIYYTVGGNLLEDIGRTYTDSLGAQDDVIKSLIKSWLVNNGYLITDFKDFNINDLAIRANFQPYIEGNISSEKWDYNVSKVSEILNNQKDTTLDIGRYGVVMNTIANRLSNGNWIVKVHHEDETELWELFDYTSDLYKVIRAKYEFYPNEIIGTYELSLRWATINGYQSVYKNTDPYSIGRDNVNSNFRYTEYLEFSTTDRTNTGSLTTQGKKTLMNMFDYDSADDLPVNTGICLSEEQPTYKIAMGVMSTGAKGIRFIGKFNEQKNAGYELVSDAIGEASNAVPYTDDNGYMESILIDYAHDYTVTGGQDSYPKLNSPVFLNLFDPSALTVYKNPNEIFGITTELLPCTDEEGIYVYNGFSRLNNLVNGGSISNVKIYFSNGTVQYDEFDTVPKDVSISQPISSAIISKSSMIIDISSVPGIANATWAVGVDDELFFAINYIGVERKNLNINNLKERSTTEQL